MTRIFPTEDTTSALGSMLTPAVLPDLLWSTFNADQATTSHFSDLIILDRTVSGPLGQVSPTEAERSTTSGAAIMEIRRRSGLTWNELADLFQVSRRSLHHWANGKVVNAAHDRTIRRVLDAIRQLDRGEARRTRDFLHTIDSSGRSILELLTLGKIAEALDCAEPVVAKRFRPLTPLAAYERRALRPPAPADVIDALQDRPDSIGSAVLGKFRRLPKKARA